MAVASERDALLPNGARPHSGQHAEPYWQRLLSIIKVVVPMSFFSVGGRASHLGLAHDRFVVANKWVSDERFLELLSIASATPGPGSGQVVSAVGFYRAGPLGGVVALVFWALPGFLIQMMAGLGAKSYFEHGLPPWLASLAPAAVSMVVNAAIRLWAKGVGDDQLRAFVAGAAACTVIATQGLSSLVFPIVMAVGGTITVIGHKTGRHPMKIADERGHTATHSDGIGISPRAGTVILSLWFAFLLALAVYRPQDTPHHTVLIMFFALYWNGAIVFGGIQVLLPMLLHNFVDFGWMTKEQFFVGYALVQSLPGPQFNISAYLGAVLYGPIGAVVAAIALFSPGIILFLGLLPLWERVRGNHGLQVFLTGVNAASCGLIVAAIFQLWEKAVHSNADAAVALGTGLLVGVFDVASPVAITVGAGVGYLLSPGLLNIGQAPFCA